MGTIITRLNDQAIQSEEALRLLTRQVNRQDSILWEMGSLNKQAFGYSQKVSEQLVYLRRSDDARMNTAKSRFLLDIADLHKFIGSYDTRQRQLMYDHPAAFQYAIIAGMPSSERIAYYKDLSKIIELHINNLIILSDTALFQIWNTFNGYLNSYIDSASNPLPHSLFHLGGNNPLPRREDQGKPMSDQEAQRFMSARDAVVLKTTDKLKEINQSSLYFKFHFY